MRLSILLFFIFSQLTSCTFTPKDNNIWNEVIIDPTISKGSVYKELNKYPERFSVLEKQDTLMKRTSAVEYIINRKMNPGEYKNPQPNNCRAFFINTDTLLIDIGMGNGFGGSGFTIKLSNKQFYTQPYFSTDVINLNEPPTEYKTEFQSLILDKDSYHFGDSLYGKIDFKASELSDDSTVIEHYGIGFFRTKIGKL